MDGLMQERPLLVSTIMEHAGRFHGQREIVSRSVDGSIHRYNYAECLSRSKKLAKAMIAMGIKPGDRIATLAWNTYRHLEAWYGIPGMGGVCHTVNPRLFRDQISYILNHAEDRLILADTDQVELLEQIAPALKYAEKIVFLADRHQIPDSGLENVLCYDELLADHDDDFDWPVVDENDAAGMCYTSGTTGNPKGVVYSHRALVLHGMMCATADIQAIRSVDTVMPVTPMFHANCWGLAHNVPMCGAKLVLPGRHMDAASLFELLEGEAVTMASGVPTVWNILVDWLEAEGKKLDSLKHIMVGGAAMPRSLTDILEREYDVRVGHAWGMTEMTPVGTTGHPTAEVAELPYEKRLDYQETQGRGIYGVELKITDDDGRALAWDGQTSGHLKVRGPWVARAYFKNEGGAILDDEGWFDTGDIATISDKGYMRITDRSKDVIKSGGEWISSIDLENIAVGHPDIAEAAVIGVPHPKWDERPLLIVVAKQNRRVSSDQVIEFLRDKVASWWLPDAVEFIDEIPHTATGKISKKTLREKFAGYRFAEKDES